MPHMSSGQTLLKPLCKFNALAVMLAVDGCKTSDWETGTRRLQPVGGVEGWKTSVNHGPHGQRNDVTEDEELSELTWPRLSSLKSRLNPNFTQVKCPFHKLLYGRGSCWGDTRMGVPDGEYMSPCNERESNSKRHLFRKEKKRRRQADRPQRNWTINKKSKPHWWPDCQKGLQSLRGLNLHLSLFLAALPQTALIGHLTDIRLAAR